MKGFDIKRWWGRGTKFTQELKIWWLEQQKQGDVIV